MWIERTTFTTVYKLPGILRWFEATDIKHVSMRVHFALLLLLFWSVCLCLSPVLCNPANHHADHLVPAGERHRDHGVHQREDSDHDQPVPDGLEPSHQPTLHAAQRHRGPSCDGRLRQVWEGNLLPVSDIEKGFRRLHYSGALFLSYLTLFFVIKLFMLHFDPNKITIPISF